MSKRQSESLQVNKQLINFSHVKCGLQLEEGVISAFDLEPFGQATFSSDAEPAIVAVIQGNHFTSSLFIYSLAICRLSKVYFLLRHTRTFTALGEHVNANRISK